MSGYAFADMENERATQVGRAHVGLLIPGSIRRLRFWQLSETTAF
jgi:hypothetical protein